MIAGSCSHRKYKENTCTGKRKWRQAENTANLKENPTTLKRIRTLLLHEGPFQEPPRAQSASRTVPLPLFRVTHHDFTPVTATGRDGV